MSQTLANTRMPRPTHNHPLIQQPKIRKSLEGRNTSTVRRMRVTDTLSECVYVRRWYKIPQASATALATEVRRLVPVLHVPGLTCPGEKYRIPVA